MALLLHQIELLMPPGDPGANGSASQYACEPAATGLLNSASKKQMSATFTTMDKLNRCNHARTIYIL